MTRRGTYQGNWGLHCTHGYTGDCTQGYTGDCTQGYIKDCTQGYINNTEERSSEGCTSTKDTNSDTVQGQCGEGSRIEDEMAEQRDEIGIWGSDGERETRTESRVWSQGDTSDTRDQDI